MYLKVKAESGIQLPDFDTREDLYNTYPYFQELLPLFEVAKIYKPVTRIKGAFFENTYQIEFNQPNQIEAFIKSLGEYDFIEFVQAVPLYTTFETPNDPAVGANYLWYLETVEAYTAWDLANPQADVVVAIVDNAVQTTHEDLAENIWQNTIEANGTPGIDDDGNGYIDDINGWNGADNNNNPNPPANANETYMSHGTHCAGTAGAVTNNGRGIAAIARRTKIMACRGANNEDQLSGIVQALEYAVINQPDIISCSWGGQGNDPVIANLMQIAQNNGSIVVVSAGNSGLEGNPLLYPAALETTISVANSTLGDEKCVHSSYGTWVDITAPGGDIVSSVPYNANNSTGWSCSNNCPNLQGTAYACFSGTSMACPNVASTLALMKSHAPNKTNAELINCLYSTADDIHAANPQYVGLLGAGRINVRKAIECLSSTTSGCAAPSNLGVANITETTATFTWGTAGGATAYNIEIRVQGNSQWFSFPNNPFTGNSLDITGMEASTTYEIRIQSVCGSTQSAFSAPFTFSTSGGGNNNEACTQFNTGPFTNFLDLNPIDCSNGIVEITAFQAWSNESYIIEDAQPGQSYVFSICNGYNPNNWVAELTVMEYDGNNAGVPNTVMGNTVACNLEFTVPSSYPGPVDLLLIIADHNNCGGTTAQVDNGFPAFGCTDTPGGNACIDFNTGPFTNFIDLNPTDCSNGIVEITAFQAWSNESYIVENAQPGQAYIFSICNGYNPNNWEAELTVMEFDGNDNGVPNTVMGNALGCNLEFIVPNTYSNPVDLLLIIANTNDCGGATASVDNGFPAFGCASSTGGGDCTTPSGLSVSNIQANEVLLGWNAAQGAESYTIQARRVGTVDWIEGIGITDLSVSYSGLEPCTDYEFRVQSVCTNGATSDFSSTFTFSTDGCSNPCPTPSNISVQAVNNNSAQISWQGTPDAIAYRLNFRTGSITWQSMVVTENPYTLSNLTSCLDYEIQMQTICSNSFGDVSPIVSFETNCPSCEAPQNVRFEAITPSSATIVWDAVDIATAYDLRAREVGTSEWIEGSFTDIGVSYTGLSACANYEVQIRSVCDATPSSYSNLAQFTTQCGNTLYCTSQGEESSYEWIERIAIGDFNNTSGNNFGYGNFQQSNITLASGASYALTLEPGFSDTPFNEYWRIWMDLDGDGNFAANELVFDGNQAQNSTINTNITIPNIDASMLNTATAMRVSMKWIDPQTDADPPSPCLTFGFGEVEDYRVTFSAGPTSTSEIAIEDVLNIYPNPNKGLFTLDVQLNERSNIGLRVFNAQGALLSELEFKDLTAARRAVDLSNLASGIYWIELRAGTQSYHQKMIISK